MKLLKNHIPFVEVGKETELNKLTIQLAQKIQNTNYVGKLVYSTTNPATKYGGTWETLTTMPTAAETNALGEVATFTSIAESSVPSSCQDWKNSMRMNYYHVFQIPNNQKGMIKIYVTTGGIIQIRKLNATTNAIISNIATDYNAFPYDNCVEMQPNEKIIVTGYQALSTTGSKYLVASGFNDIWKCISV